MTRKRDVACAIALALTSFAVYVATLAPGLIAITDTPKFQFIGRVLGTAHPPGYPLYVLVSHVFGYLPLGSLAYRINLMSAFFSAVACGLTFLSARAIGARIPVAAASVLGLAFGSTFWFVSTIAEVYALNAFLVAAIILTLLTWHRSQRATTFYTAVALVGIASGNHISIVFMVPATALFACAVAPRFALRPRTVALSALIVIVGLAQYLFIVLRTHQGAWGEAPASNLPELVGVMSGSQYFGDIMPGGIRQFFVERIPIIGQAFIRETTVVGVALALFGVIACVRHQATTLLFLATALAGYAGFTASYMPHEFEVFLIPGFIVCWLLAAAGAQWIVDGLGARTRPWLAALASAALVIVPVWQIARNYDARDLRYARADLRFFDALFEQLPERSALVHNDFLIDRMVYYKMLGEHADERRHIQALLPVDIEPVGRAFHDGRQVFAFPQTATAMRLLDGAEFSYTPLALSNGTIEEYLADLPRGTLVAVGVPGIHMDSFARSGRLALSAIGFDRALSGSEVAGIAVIGIRGARSLNGLSYPTSAPGQVDTVYRGSGMTTPITVRADGESAAIVFGGREIVRSEAGMVVAVWDRARLTAAFVVPAATLTTPVLPTPYATYQLRTLRERRPMSGEAADLTSTLSTGHFVYSPPPGRSRLVVYAGRQRPLAPSLLESSARDWPALDVKSFDGPQSTAGTLTRSMTADGMPSSSRLMTMQHVYRIAVETNWSFPAGVHIGLGGLPDVVVGRLADGANGSVYPVDLMSHLKRVDERTWLLQMARDYQEQLVGPGWSPVQFDGIAGYRETVDREAELLLPVAAPATLRVGIQLLLLPGSEGKTATVELDVNGRPLPPITPTPEWKRYWWDIGAEATIAGANSLVIVCPPGQRIAVSDVLVDVRR